jgi:hypothetical protein
LDTIAQGCLELLSTAACRNELDSPAVEDNARGMYRTVKETRGQTQRTPKSSRQPEPAPDALSLADAMVARCQRVAYDCLKLLFTAMR